MKWWNITKSIWNLFLILKYRSTKNIWNLFLMLPLQQNNNKKAVWSSCIVPSMLALIWVLCLSFYLLFLFFYLFIFGIDQGFMSFFLSSSAAPNLPHWGSTLDGLHNFFSQKILKKLKIYQRGWTNTIFRKSIARS